MPKLICEIGASSWFCYKEIFSACFEQLRVHLQESVQAAPRYVTMHLYKQSGRCQDVFGTSLPEDEHLVVRNMSNKL
jgi:hypothetical protein